MKVQASVLAMILILSGTINPAAAQTVIANCTVNCTTTVTVNITNNITQINVTNYQFTLYNLSNITIIDYNLVLNLTTKISDLQANLTSCQNKVDSELADLRNQTAISYLIGKLENQTIEITKLKTENQILSNNVSIYSDSYLNLQACIGTISSKESILRNETAHWQNLYYQQQKDFQTYIYLGVGLIIVAYLARPTVEKMAKEKFGERDIGERRV